MQLIILSPAQRSIESSCFCKYLSSVCAMKERVDIFPFAFRTTPSETCYRAAEHRFFRRKEHFSVGCRLFDIIWSCAAADILAFSDKPFIVFYKIAGYTCMSVKTDYYISLCRHKRSIPSCRLYSSGIIQHLNRKVFLTIFSFKIHEFIPCTVRGITVNKYQLCFFLIKALRQYILKQMIKYSFLIIGYHTQRNCHTKHRYTMNNEQ